MPTKVSTKEAIRLNEAHGMDCTYKVMWCSGSSVSHEKMPWDEMRRRGPQHRIGLGRAETPRKRGVTLEGYREGNCGGKNVPLTIWEKQKRRKTDSDFGKGYGGRK